MAAKYQIVADALRAHIQTGKYADAAALLDIDPNLEEPDHRALAREVRIAFSGEVVAGG